MPLQNPPLTDHLAFIQHALLSVALCSSPLSSVLERQAWEKEKQTQSPPSWTLQWLSERPSCPSNSSEKQSSQHLLPSPSAIWITHLTLIKCSSIKLFVLFRDYLLRVIIMMRALLPTECLLYARHSFYSYRLSFSHRHCLKGSNLPLVTNEALEVQRW